MRGMQGSLTYMVRASRRWMDRRWPTSLRGCGLRNLPMAQHTKRDSKWLQEEEDKTLIQQTTEDSKTKKA